MRKHWADGLFCGQKKKGLRFLVSLYSRMVRPEGFELPTYRFVACCSIQLSYERPTTANIGKTDMVVKHFFVDPENIFLFFPPCLCLVSGRTQNGSSALTT